MNDRPNLRASQEGGSAPGIPRRANRGKRHWFAGAALSLLVICGVAIVWWNLRAPNLVSYSTAPVTKGPIRRLAIATGTVNPELTIIVGTYVSGVIQQLFCDYNTEVKKGQICAKIDPRPYQTVVEESEANLAVAKAQLQKDTASLNYAQAAFDRAARLIKSNTVSQDTYDNAKSTYDQSQAQVALDQATIQQRQASLDAARVNLDYTNITSPVDGVVVSRNVTQGQTVAASFQTPTLFLIATDLTKMQVDANVSESDIGGVKVGAKVRFTVEAFPKRIFEGVVSQIRQSPQTIQNVVTYDVVVSVNNQDLALKPGMTAGTRIIIDQRSDVLRVPNAALRFRIGRVSRSANRQPQVWVLQNGVPVAVAVTAGLDDDSFTEIVSGNIKEGDEVITGERYASTTAANRPRLRF